MKIKLISDIHFNTLKNFGREVIEPIYQGDFDVLVVAGDLSDHKDYERDLELLATSVSQPIVLVAGNHDFWHSNSYEHGLEHIRNLCSKYSHVHFLENENVTIGEQRFVGCSLWFDHKPDFYDRKWTDFTKVPGLLNNIRHINQISFEYLISAIRKDDIVITHHLPSQKSINHVYLNNSFNKFYFSGCDFIIKENEPKIWIHGHTHDPCDYNLYNTRVICNPLGYYIENKCKFRSGQLVDI
jgi:predicted phosphodiesterase